MMSWKVIMKGAGKRSIYGLAPDSGKTALIYWPDPRPQPLRIAVTPLS